MSQKPKLPPIIYVAPGLGKTEASRMFPEKVLDTSEFSGPGERSLKGRAKMLAVWPKVVQRLGRHPQPELVVTNFYDFDGSKDLPAIELSAIVVPSDARVPMLLHDRPDLEGKVEKRRTEVLDYAKSKGITVYELGDQEYLSDFLVDKSFI